jgi:hypothetical protein
MDKENSLSLYKQGKEAWNIWANEMLAKKAKLEEKGLWQTDNVKQIHNQATEEWISEASVEFSGDLFKEEMDFYGLIFPYKVNFHNTTFLDVARFGDAIFNGDINFSFATFNSSANFKNTKFFGDARFSNAKFSKFVNFDNAIFDSKAEFRETIFCENAIFLDSTFSNNADFEKTIFSGEAFFIRAKFCANAWLAKVQFNGNAKFESAVFEGNARFHNTTFSQDMLFDQILFKGFTDFSSAYFKKKISFIAIHGNGYFSFKDTRFYSVPDFNQAHFIEAPQFDESDFSKAIANRQYDNNGINNISSKWRSLKRLAIQAHDHKSELFFFAEEIKSQRGAFLELFNLVATDKQVWQGDAQYCLGYLYEIFSDFGRSLWRPTIWLVFFTAIFFLIYLSPFAMQNEETTQITTSCERTESALYLSFHHAFPIFFASHSTKLMDSYKCIYGQKDQQAIIPDMAIYVSVVQTAISTMLIFLILLALRNHFKIK